MLIYHLPIKISQVVNYDFGTVIFGNNLAIVVANASQFGTVWHGEWEKFFSQVGYIAYFKYLPSILIF